MLELIMQSVTMAAQWDRNNPIGSFDNPTEQWRDMLEKFPQEDDCIRFLYHTKWPDGFRCPRCQGGEAYVITSRKLPLYQCRSCRHQTSLTAGTIMENSRTPLSKWLLAFYFVSRIDGGISAVTLKQIIQVTYKTAWSMLHQIRSCISDADREQPLVGIVRGGLGICGKIPLAQTPELHPQEKPIIVSTALNHEEQPALIKMKVVPLEHMKEKLLTRSGINDFIEQNVDAPRRNVSIFQHVALIRPRIVKKCYDRVMMQFKELYHGLGSKHLQSYLDEACYRMNLSLQDDDTSIQMMQSLQEPLNHHSAHHKRSIPANKLNINTIFARLSHLAALCVQTHRFRPSAWGL